jgi:hypothetical protein
MITMYGIRNCDTLGKGAGPAPCTWHPLCLSNLHDYCSRRRVSHIVALGAQSSDRRKLVMHGEAA